MELRERKQIVNGKLPEFAEGKLLHKPTLQGLDGMMGNGANFLGSAVNSFGGVKSSSDIMTESGDSVGQGSGFTYQKQNSIDAGSLMSEVSQLNTANTLSTAAAGASLGSAFGPIGAGIGGVVGGAVGFIGGLFRKNKMADRIKEALLQAVRNNNFSLASALTNYLTNQYSAEHGNTLNDLLYSAKDGHKPVYSASGYADGKPNAMGSHHEWVIDTFNGEEMQLPGKPDKEDTVELKLKHPEATAIVSNNRYLDGIRNSDYYTLTKDLDGALARDQWYRNMKDYRTVKQLGNRSFNAKNGVLPGFAGGLLPYLIDDKTPNLGNTYKAEIPELPILRPGTLVPVGKTPLGLGLTQSDINRAMTAKIPRQQTPATTSSGGLSQDTEESKRPSSLIPDLLGAFGLATAYRMMPDKQLGSADTQVKNLYARLALSTLAGLRSNKYALMLEAKDAEARNAYMFKHSGYRGAHLYLAGVSSNIALLKLYANILANSNKEDNTYLSNYANSALGVGNNLAQWDQYHLSNKYDTYARSHGAYTKGVNTALSEANKVAQWMYQQRMKKDLSYDTLALYNDDYELRKNGLKRLFI